MKQLYGHSMYPLMFCRDEASKTESAARRRGRRVKKTKQQETELNMWEGEGGKPVSRSMPS
jgi:hypothetical protein